MDEMQRLRLRCLLLEADKDAEIAAKNVYRNKLSELAGKGNTRSDAAHRPQTSGLDLIPWDASTPSTLPAVRHIRIYSVSRCVLLN